MGHDSEGSRNDKSSGTVPGNNVQGGGTVSVTIWKRNLGVDQGDAHGPDSVTPTSGATYRADDGEMWVRQRVGVSNGREGDGICGDPPYQIIHQETTDDHSGEGGMPANLYNVHRGGEDARDKPDGALVGSTRDK